MRDPSGDKKNNIIGEKMETNKTLPELMGEIYTLEYKRVHDQEVKKDTFLHQDDFETVEMRMRVASTIAQEQAIKAGSYAAALHRRSNHKDDRTEEISALTNPVALRPEYKAMVDSQQSWWMS